VPGDRANGWLPTKRDQRQRRLPAARPPEVFFPGPRGQNEGQPVTHSINNNAMLAKVDGNLSAANNHVRVLQLRLFEEHEQTFDVATYGNSANGTEGRRRSTS